MPPARSWSTPTGEPWRNLINHKAEFMIGRFRALPFAISYGQPHTAVMGHHIPAVVGIRRRISGMQRAACWPAGIRTTSRSLGDLRECRRK
jgi:hypothetical protein